MTISIWRYSHLLLAITASLFLVIASVTGIILAFEPISDAARPYATVNLKEVTLAETVSALRKNYSEVLKVEIDANDFVIASVITEKGDSERIFVDGVSGKKLGNLTEKHPLFQWTTNLHRSLFLKSIGRFFVGLASFLLCLIAVTGFFLLIKRQGGIRKLFSKIRKEHFAQRYHVIVGRWALLPVLMVAATGVYLSAEKFSLLPKAKLEHEKNTISANTVSGYTAEVLPIFEHTSLNAVRSLTFPFSEAPEDYFELALDNRELYVHQYSGEILSEVQYPLVLLASRFSFIAHTGQGSVIWSIVLLMTSLSLLFFIYSGFAMALKRKKKVKAIARPQNKDECEFILLVGSETGNTNEFATIFQNALIKAGKTVFKTELNHYSTYKKATHIIIFTATYGDGDAPTNARNFFEIFDSVQVEQPLNFSVLGFGSLVYPQYCKFAVEVNACLRAHAKFDGTLPLYKINDRSFEAFTNWARKWGEATEIHLPIEPPKKKAIKIKTEPFSVVYKSPINTDNTFTIRLRPEKKTKFQSGDLLAYRPKKEENPRLYSIARMDTDVLLSIKKHEFGRGSRFLYGLSENDTVDATIQRNPEFHFPKNAREIVCIANGTGIAPFLGIIAENSDSLPIQLYWGGRTRSSFKTYEEIICSALEAKKLAHIEIAYSQGYPQKKYVQDLLLEKERDIAKKLELGAVFMICGSIAMQNRVLDVLEAIAKEKLNRPLSDFEQKEQLKMDCY